VIALFDETILREASEEETVVFSTDLPNITDEKFKRGLV